MVFIFFLQKTAVLLLHTPTDVPHLNFCVTKVVMAILNGTYAIYGLSLCLFITFLGVSKFCSNSSCLSKLICRKVRKIRLIENWWYEYLLLCISFRVFSMTHRCGSQMILAEWVLTQLCDSLWQVARMIARWVVVKRKNDERRSLLKKSFSMCQNTFLYSAS